MKLETLERLVRGAGRRFGIDIKRYRPGATPVGQLAIMLNARRVNAVLDVGANVGQFTRELRSGGYRSKVISFEPLAEAHARLERARRGDSSWLVAPRVAIGDSATEIEIHVARNSVSSSVLDMLDTHTRAAPDSGYVGTQRVSMMRLDDVAPQFLIATDVPFLKIDTQGFEDRVLDGAPDVLARCVGVHLELSFVPLYDGQKLYDDLVSRLRGLGFELWGIWPGVCTAENGRMLQVDAVLFRE